MLTLFEEAFAQCKCKFAKQPVLLKQEGKGGKGQKSKHRLAPNQAVLAPMKSRQNECLGYRNVSGDYVHCLHYMGNMPNRQGQVYKS